MNPVFFITVFAWLAIVALGFSVLSDFWLPMLVGGTVVTLLVRLALPSR
jgi:hypothetical protein